MSRLGSKHTPESLAKMCAAQKGRTLSPEHRAKISASLKGKHRTPRIRKKGLKQLEALAWVASARVVIAKFDDPFKILGHVVDDNALIVETNVGYFRVDPNLASISGPFLANPLKVVVSAIRFERVKKKWFGISRVNLKGCTSHPMPIPAMWNERFDLLADKFMTIGVIDPPVIEHPIPENKRMKKHGDASRAARYAKKVDKLTNWRL